MKKKFFIGAMLIAGVLSFTSCKDEPRCWQITMQAFGESDVEFFWGTKKELKEYIKEQENGVKVLGLDSEYKFDYKESATVMCLDSMDE